MIEFNEPWVDKTTSVILGSRILDANACPVISCEDSINLSDEHRKRIVACVNACRGIPTERLQAVGTPGVTIHVKQIIPVVIPPDAISKSGDFTRDENWSSGKAPLDDPGERFDQPQETKA